MPCALSSHRSDIRVSKRLNIRSWFNRSFAISWADRIVALSTFRHGSVIHRDLAVSRHPRPLPKNQLRDFFFATSAPSSSCRKAQNHLDAGLDGLIFSFPHPVSPDEVAFAGRTLSPHMGNRDGACEDR